MQVIIMRGLPGSGKTYYVKTKIEQGVICSADDYHMVDGVYKYDPKNAAVAHKQCFAKYLSTMFKEKMPDYLVVDNTNTSLVELAPYVRLAEVLDIEYKIVYVTCDPLLAIQRNVHQVPANTILAMHKNLLTEIVPTWWNQEVV